MTTTHDKHYLAFVLDNASREKLIKQFPPSQEKVFCHHVTLKFFNVTDDDVQLWENVNKAYVVAYVADSYLEAFVVDLKSNTTREDGGTYHVTHSLDPAHRKPVDSNRLIKSKEWVKLQTQISITGRVQLELK